MRSGPLGKKRLGPWVGPSSGRGPLGWPGSVSDVLLSAARRPRCAPWETAGGRDHRRTSREMGSAGRTRVPATAQLSSAVRLVGMGQVSGQLEPRFVSLCAGGGMLM